MQTTEIPVSEYWGRRGSMQRARKSAPPSRFNSLKGPTSTDCGPYPVQSRYPIVSGHGTDAGGVKAMERDCGNALLQR